MRRIFMAEDNPADVYMLDLALKESGAVFELEVAYTGKKRWLFWNVKRTRTSRCSI